MGSVAFVYYTNSVINSDAFDIHPRIGMLEKRPYIAKQGAPVAAKDGIFPGSDMGNAQYGAFTGWQAHRFWIDSKSRKVL